ncbi:MAG: hypothetical protein WC236_15165 [Gallionellaceae bacterium]|jgi:hypothetical protein
MTCTLCAIDNGNYDFKQICCRVRFLMTQRDVANRRGWIERWEKKFGSAESATLKAEFEKQWKEKFKV